MMILSPQSTGTFPSRIIAFIKSAMNLQQISGAAFNISATTPEGPAAFPFFMRLRDFNVSSGVMNCAVPEIETTKFQYSTNGHNFVSMQASLMCHQMKDYHHHLVYISLRLHPDFLYSFVWRHERCFLYCL